MSADPDLSGQWSGIYNYPALFPPNSFEATVRDSNGVIAGVIVEPGDNLDVPGTTRHAVIEGSREGSRVRFVKIYDQVDLEAVHYDGRIDPGGDEIEGEWTIPGRWSGTFLMVRGGRGEARAERRRTEKVEL